MKCMLCSRKAASDLCTYHRGAKGKVEESYRLWTEAYGEIEWKDHLDKVKRSEQTGSGQRR